MLYHVRRRSKLRHLFYVGSGGANFGQLVSRRPSSGRSIFFGRTNQGSGQGNRLFRLRPPLAASLFAGARRRAARTALTWRGDRFLLSRTALTGGRPPTASSW